jgi:hypothetical protein
MLSGPYYCNGLSIKTYLLVLSTNCFEIFLPLLSQDVDAFLPKSGNTVHNWLPPDTGKQDIKSKLKEGALSKTHLV